MSSPKINSFPIGLGLLRLATEGRPSHEDAMAIIHAALDAGIRLLDTADSYCLDEKEKHYGERLAKESLGRWNGPREEVVIATKAGMIRPKGKWVVLFRREWEENQATLEGVRHKTLSKAEQKRLMDQPLVGQVSIGFEYPCEATSRDCVSWLTIDVLEKRKRKPVCVVNAELA